MTNNKFSQLIDEYLDDFKKIYKTAKSSGQTTPELSYRPPLDSLFRSISTLLKNNSVDVIFEPILQKKSGRPDWRFHHYKSMGIFGYVEAKGFDPQKKVDWKPFSKQLQKYLSLGYKVILTDGIDFLFFWSFKPTKALKHIIIKKTHVTVWGLDFKHILAN